MHADMVRASIPHSRPERAHGFIFNLRRAPFDDIAVRKALSVAFDHDWVAQNLFHGAFRRIESYYPNAVLDGSGAVSDKARAAMAQWKDHIRPEAFQDTFKPGPDNLRTRLRKAGALLDGAGWHVKDGRRVHRDTGEPLRFELLLNTPQDEKTALAWQRTLERLGVDMYIRMMDSATFQKRKNDYDYDMIAFFWQNSLSPGTEHRYDLLVLQGCAGTRPV